MLRGMAVRVFSSGAKLTVNMYYGCSSRNRLKGSGETGAKQHLSLLPQETVVTDDNPGYSHASKITSVEENVYAA